MRIKVSAILMGLLLMIGLMQVSAEEFDYENEFQYMYQSTQLGTQMVTRGEDGYYFRICDILYYADETLEFAIPLCSRPECLHQYASTLMERMNCEAYLGINSTGNALQYYNGRIYVASQWDFINRQPYMDASDRVYSISSDGIERIEEDVQLGIKLPPVLHEGYYYYVYMANIEKEDGKVKVETSLARKSLDGGEEEILFSAPKINGLTTMTAYQDYIYLVYWVNDDCYTLIHRISDGENMFLSNGEGTRPIFFFEEDHLLVTYLGLEEQEQPIWITTLEGEVIGQLKDILLEEGWFVGSDGTYLYMDNCNDMSVVSSRENTRKIRYYDRETLEYIGEIDLGLNVMRSPIAFGDENYIFYCNIIRDDYDTVQQMYLDKKELENGNVEPRLLIEGEEYVIEWSFTY